MYSFSRKTVEKTNSYVEFHVNERIQRICMWVNQNFLLENDIDPPVETTLNFHANCLRDGTSLGISMDLSGKITVYTKNMLLASDIVRSLANFFNLDHLQVSKTI